MIRNCPIVAFCVLATLVAGCGSDDDATTSGGPAGSGASAASGSPGGAGGAMSSTSGSGGAACKDLEEPVVRGLHVSPEGSPGGDGSPEAPFDLASALSAGSPVAPGETIHLAGGVYSGTFTSELVGTEASPIAVRSLPGSWAVIDAAGAEGPTLVVTGSWTTFRDLEVTNSSPPARGSGGPGGNIGVDVFGVGTKLVHLVIHDSGGSGVGTWIEAEQAETYGSIIYNNGRFSNFDHGIYAQNQNGEKRLTDNVVFNNYAYGIHAYGSDASFLQHFVIEGNTVFHNGAIGDTAANLLLGGGAPTVDNVVSANMAYSPPGSGGTNVRLGYGGAPHGLVAEGNYIAGGEPSLRFEGWGPEVGLSGNTVVGGDSYLVMLEPSGQEASLVWDDTAYFHTGRGAPFSLGGEEQDFETWKASTGFDASSSLATSSPTDAAIFVRPDVYEQGRAVLTVFNWPLADTVEVDFGAFLEVGHAFEVRTAENYLAGPILEGIYDGSSVELPMTGHTVAAPIGIEAPPTTSPAFAVFLVRRVACPRR